MRKPFDKSAPRRPPSAFVLFMKQRRLSSASVASLPFGARNRALGVEWNALSADDKQVYLDEVSTRRDLYNTELEEYKKSDAYKTWLAKSGSDKKAVTSTVPGRKRKLAATGCDEVGGLANANCRVPIFTHTFLEYNRLREAVLRSLKKKAVQLEEETALLSKHVENLVAAETRVKSQIETNSKLLTDEEQLSKRLHREVSSALGELTLPYEETVDALGTVARGSERITENSVDLFLSHLDQLHKANTHPDLIAKTTQAIRSAVQKKTFTLLTC